MIEGQKLREIREAHDLTQKDVAEVMGTSDTAISRSENGRVEVTPSFAKRYLAAIYGVEPSDIALFVHVRGFVDNLCVLETGGRA